MSSDPDHSWTQQVTYLDPDQPAVPEAAQPHHSTITDLDEESHRKLWKNTMTGHPIAYSFETAAQAVSMSSSYIQKEIAAGRLGFTRIGRRVTIPHAELVRWYESIPTGPRP